MSVGDLWRCLRCGYECHRPVGVTALTCACGAELELVELEASPQLAIRPATAQRSCTKAREKYWADKLAAAPATPLDVDLQQRFLEWCGAGGGI